MIIKLHDGSILNTKNIEWVGPILYPHWIATFEVGFFHGRQPFVMSAEDENLDKLKNDRELIIRTIEEENEI